MCGGSKGQQRSQQTTTTQAAPEAMAAYKDILTRAQEVAATPYQAYTGERVAGFTPYQEQAFGQIAGAQQAGMGTLGTAQQLAQAGAGPITASQIQTAMNPYQQAVVQSTMDELMRQEAIQQSALKGQAISAGAFGGDRAGVAAAELARNQEQVRAKTLAGLMQQGYSQAVAQAQADRAASQVGAGQMAALAQQEQVMPLTASSALAAAGAQQQQLEQQRLNVPYQTYLEQRAYPFQTQQWLAGLATGVGGAMGGTSQAQGVQTPAQPNPLNQILGAGLAVGSFALPGGGTVGGSLLSPFLRAEGGRVDGNIIEGTAIEIPEKADGGGLSVPAPTGMPYGGGFIPAATLQARPLQIASAPLPQAAPVTDPAKQFVGQAMDLAKSIRDARPKPEMPSAESWQQGTSVIPAATGGRIHMADGGVPEGNPVEPITERQVEATPGLAGAEYTAPAGEGAPSGLASASIPGRMGLGAAAQQPAETKGGFELSPEARQAMMQAGFALMASKSPWVGQAIGEAGMTGTQAYAEAQKIAQARQLQEEKLRQSKWMNTGAYTKQGIPVYTNPIDGVAVDAFGRKVDPQDLTVPNLEKIRIEEMKQKRTEAMQPWRITAEGSLVPTPGGPHDPQTIAREAAARRPSGISDEAASAIATRYIAGDKKALSDATRGWGAASTDNMTKIFAQISQQMREQGLSPKEISAKQAMFTADASAATQTAKRAAAVDTAVQEALETFPLAKAASADLARTNFVPWNQAVQMVQRGTSNPELARYVTALRGTMTAYSQAMSRTGTNSVYAQKAAEELLNKAAGHREIIAVLEQMQLEMEAAKRAPERVREIIAQRLGEKSEKIEDKTHGEGKFQTPPAKLDVGLPQTPTDRSKLKAGALPLPRTRDGEPDTSKMIVGQTYIQDGRVGIWTGTDFYEMR